MPFDIVWLNRMTTLEPCTPQVEVKEPHSWPKKKVPCQKQEENDMSSYASAATINVTDTSEKDQRKFLLRQLTDSMYSKKTALKHKFGLIADAEPTTFADLLDRIQNGKYIIEDERKNTPSYLGLSYITWRDPAIKQDSDGYAAAKKELKKAFTKTEQDIIILTPAEGLDSLRAFEDIATS